MSESRCRGAAVRTLLLGLPLGAAKRTPESPLAPAHFRKRRPGAARPAVTPVPRVQRARERSAVAIAFGTVDQRQLQQVSKRASCEFADEPEQIGSQPKVVRTGSDTTLVTSKRRTEQRRNVEPLLFDGLQNMVCRGTGAASGEYVTDVPQERTESIDGGRNRLTAKGRYALGQFARRAGIRHRERWEALDRQQVERRGHPREQDTLKGDGRLKFRPSTPDRLPPGFGLFND